MSDSIVPIPADFELCGGCGGASRQLTEAEAVAMLDWAASQAREGRAIAALGALSWPAELVARSATLCSCPQADRLRSVPDHGFFVYRLFDEGGRLLYVGMSRRLRSRLRTHYADRPYVVRHEYEELPTEAEMVALEAAFIADLNPPLNSTGNG